MRSSSRTAKGCTTCCRREVADGPGARHERDRRRLARAADHRRVLPRQRRRIAPGSTANARRNRSRRFSNRCGCDNTIPAAKCTHILATGYEHSPFPPFHEIAKTQGLEDVDDRLRPRRHARPADRARRDAARRGALTRLREPRRRARRSRRRPTAPRARRAPRYRGRASASRRATPRAARRCASVASRRNRNASSRCARKLAASAAAPRTFTDQRAASSGICLELLVRAEHGGRRLLAPARNAGVAVGAVADEREPVRHRAWARRRTSRSTPALVEALAPQPVEAHDARRRRTHCARSLSGEQMTICSTPGCGANRAAAAASASSHLELDHRPRDRCPALGIASSAGPNCAVQSRVDAFAVL